MRRCAAGWRLIDIGANLTDPMFSGVYHGKTKHRPDLEAVLERAWSSGVERIIITAGGLMESAAALRLARTDDRLYCTVGVHPTRCGEFGDNPKGHFEELRSLAELGKREGKCVAIGECGLDFDRLSFCPEQVQRKCFEMQFGLAEATGLPMFLHNRNTGGAFTELVRANRHRFRHGVVHSFTGSAQEALELCALDCFIGVNGCSLKTEENLETVRVIPEDRIMLETDAPWCEIRASHAGQSHVQTVWPAVRKPDKWESGKCVKGRQEPCHMAQVLEVVAACRGTEPSLLAATVLQTTERVFFPPAGTLSQGAGANLPVKEPEVAKEDDEEPSWFSSFGDSVSEAFNGVAKAFMEAVDSFGNSSEGSSARNPSGRGQTTPPIGHTAFSWRHQQVDRGTGAAAAVPIGHTSFSWRH